MSCLQMDTIREEEYAHCDSPRANKMFINMLDSQMSSKEGKIKSVEGKSIHLSSPSSYASSSPSSTSSMSSTSIVQHQKQTMAGQALNGSSEYISQTANLLSSQLLTRSRPPQCTTFWTCQTSISCIKCSHTAQVYQIWPIARRPWVWAAVVAEEDQDHLSYPQDFRSVWVFHNRLKCPSLF